MIIGATLVLAGAFLWFQGATGFNFGNMIVGMAVAGAGLVVLADRVLMALS